MEKANVYFTKEITEESLVRIYEITGKELNGKVAIKISTGEPGGHNFLNPNLIKGLVQKLKGTIVECNTAYKGKRNTTEDHLKAAEEHGFTAIARVDIMDSEGDIALPVLNGKHLEKNYVGKNIENYDSMLMLSHFKGHAMGGFGGALKNMSIGVASARGKAWIHSAGKVEDLEILWDHLAEQNDFLESMAEADQSVMNYMNDNILYINIMNNLSVDCDCNANPEDPCMKDIGILSSLDPVALDQACLDFINKSNDPGKDHFLERVNCQNGQHTIDYAEKIGLGTKEYNLIYLDEK